MFFIIFKVVNLENCNKENCSKKMFFWNVELVFRCVEKYQWFMRYIENKCFIIMFRYNDFKVFKECEKNFFYN